VPVGGATVGPDPDPDPLPVGGATVADPDPLPVGGAGPDPEPLPVGGEGPVPPIPFDTQAHLEAPAPSPPFPDPDPAPPFPLPPVPGPVGSGPSSLSHLAIVTFPFLMIKSITYMPSSSSTPVAFPLHFLSQVIFDFLQFASIIA